MTLLTRSFPCTWAPGVALVFTLASCGYALVGRGSSLPLNIKTASIPVFENQTDEPELETIVTGVVKDEFIKDGRLKIEDSVLADSVITGVITKYRLQPLRYDADNNVSEYRVILNILITHTDSRTEEKLSSRVVKTNWRYRADPAISEAEALRRDAIESATEVAAESILSLVIEAF